MNDVSGLSNQPLEPYPTDLLSIPKLDHWIELEVSGRMLISGVISRHPEYPTGMRILTSTIEGYTSDVDARVYTVTKNSKYELGERLEVHNQEHIFGAISSAHAITANAQQTIC